MTVSPTTAVFLVPALLACVALQYAAACRGPPVTGVCRARIPMWYFDQRTTTCHQFIYGGCGGNSNKFSSRRKCLRACSTTGPPKSFCKKKPDAGPCKAWMPLWYFDYRKGHCLGFVYGGCRGNSNRFPTCRKCMKACGQG
uniref:BPTI/Kunitz inhibitor domain-containing protein n=1 Tax=Amblyomma tuberculatum TaxID=48802 RepID=A0A6M2E3R4_9ACAR